MLFRSNVPQDAVVCSADHFFESRAEGYNWNPKLAGLAHHICFRKYVAALKNPSVNSIVVDNTNTKHEYMRNYVHEANNHGYDVNIVAIVANPMLAAKRNVHKVPMETVQLMNEQLKNTLKQGFPTDWKIASIVKVNNV